MGLHAVPFFVWAAHKNFAVLVQGAFLSSRIFPYLWKRVGIPGKWWPDINQNNNQTNNQIMSNKMMYSSQNVTYYSLHNLECLGHFSSSLEPLEGPVGHEGTRGRCGHPPCGTRPSVRAGGNWSQVGSQVQSAWKIEILHSQRNHITRKTYQKVCR